MEGAIRNLVAKKVLNCMCGAFSDKWFDVSKRCGKEAEALQVPWGSPIRAEAVDKKLATGQFDALTLIHNETSTGVMSPLAEIAALKKKYPDVMFIVDSVSSMTAMQARSSTRWASTCCWPARRRPSRCRRAWPCSSARPPRWPRPRTLKDRGYYFDFVEFQKNAEQNMTPSTPSIGHVYALASKLDDIFAEGLEARFARHREADRDDPRLGGEARLQPVPGAGLRVRHAHLRQQRRPARRPRRWTCPSCRSW